MLFREVKGVYVQNHEKNSTESRWVGTADLIQLAQDGEKSRGKFLNSNGNSSAIISGKSIKVAVND